MKRTELARGAALVSKTALKRTTGMPRQPRPKPRQATGKSTGGNDWPDTVRAALAARSGGMCERCWSAPATDAHHRLKRNSRNHTIQNAAHLCSPCHIDRVHGAPPAARDLGWIVPTWSRPEDVPVLLGGSRWALLTADGKYRTDQRGWVIP